MATYRKYLRWEIQNETVIVTFKGVEGLDEERLDEVFYFIHWMKTTRIILDFTNIKWIDSIFIGKIMGLKKALEEVKGTLVLRGLNACITQKLESLRMYDFFTIE